jgi:hypothetical protein
MLLECVATTTCSLRCSCPGDRVLVVDTFRNERTVAWEYEVADVSHEPYGSLTEAARLISSGVQGPVLAALYRRQHHSAPTLHDEEPPFEHASRRATPRASPSIPTSPTA